MRSQQWLWLACFGGLLAGMAGLLPALPVLAGTFDVTTTADGAAGSLRRAIQAANAQAGPDVVRVPAGTFGLTVPGKNEDLGATGDLDVRDELTIRGSGAGVTIIDGRGLDRVLDALPGVSLTLTNLTLTGGAADSGGGGIHSQGSALSMTRCVVRDNFSSGGNGGGILMTGGGSLTLDSVTVSGNGTNQTGGGIEQSQGDLTAVNCTLSNNSASSGSGSGGGLLFSGASATLTNCTVAQNRTFSSGAGILSAATTGFTLHNTLLASNISSQSGEENCAGTFTSAGHNLSSDTSCVTFLTGPGDKNNVNPRLSPLGDYGDHLPTHALLAGSPAVDAGDSAGAPRIDQRDIDRPEGPAVDIGAFELESPAGGSLVVTTFNDGGPGSLRAALKFANTKPGRDTITLAAGTYTLNLAGRDEDNGDAGDLDILDDLTIQGASAETTFIDAKGLDRVFEAASPIHRSFSNPSPLLAVLISEVTITGGRAFGDGGGVRSRGALTLDGVTVSSCRADLSPGSEPGRDGFGGGVASVQERRSTDATPLVVRNSIFDKNAAASSGGGLNEQPGSRGDVLSLADSVFTGNTAGVDGGGANQGGSVLTVSGCLASGNTAGSGGGGMCNEGGDTTLDTSLFDKNTAGDDGGGGFENQGGDLVIIGCTFSNNTGGEDGGGGFENEGGDLVMTDCIVFANKTVNDEDGGGGFENEGGDLKMTRCTISNNTCAMAPGKTDGGGGFENEGGTLEMTDCTVLRNSVNTVGGGINNEGGAATLTRCNIGLNHADGNGGGLEQEGGDLTMTDCAVNGNTAGGRGGAIDDPGSGKLTRVTVGGNTSGGGGAVAVVSAGTLTLTQSPVFANRALGFDLGGDGRTANDAADEDEGPNDLQNFPAITDARIAAGRVTIRGTLNSTASRAFHLEFFSGLAGSETGSGAGRFFLGAQSVTTDTSGNAQFTAEFAITDAQGTLFTATATDPAGNTSEFADTFARGGGTAKLSLTPRRMNFGNVRLGRSLRGLARLRNTGDAPAEGTLKISGPQFALVDPDSDSTVRSLPFSLEAGGTLSVVVEFRPKGLRHERGRLIATSASSGAAGPVQLLGCGLRSRAH